MKRTAIFLFAALALVGCDPNSAKKGMGGGAEAKIDFIYDYDEAVDKAAEEGKNVALYFTGPG